MDEERGEESTAGTGRRGRTHSPRGTQTFF